MNYDKIRKAALDKANQVRKALGLAPVDHLYKGAPNQWASCPITNTIYDDDLDRNKVSVNTGVEAITVIDVNTGKEKVFKQNRLSREFVNLFDELDYLSDPAEKANHPLIDLDSGWR